MCVCVCGRVWSAAAAGARPLYRCCESPPALPHHLSCLLQLPDQSGEGGKPVCVCTCTAMGGDKGVEAYVHVLYTCRRTETLSVLILFKPFVGFVFTLLHS